ncbi:MAG: hypothetical protein ACUVQ0_06190 [Thermoproteota archaeon]
MGSMLIELMNIFAGLILSMDILPSIPVVGRDLKKVAMWLSGIKTLIGIIAVVAGVLHLFNLQGIVAVIAGLILISGLIPNVPAMGRNLAKVIRWLGRFQTIVGLMAITIGVYGLLL